MVFAEYAERGLCNGRVSVRLSHRSIAAAVKFVAALIRVAVVTAGQAESNSSLPPGL